MKMDLNTETKLQQENSSAFEKLINIIPHPLALAFSVTFLVFIFVLAVSGKGLEELMQVWGSGMVSNFGFGMQFVLLLILSYGLAITPLFKRFISKLADSATSQGQAVILIAVFSIVLAWFNWGLGVIGGVFLAKEVARKAQKAGISLDYPLLIAAGISGVLVWECGISGNVLLFVTQSNHLLAEQLGALSLSQTAFSGLNIIVSILILIAIPLSLMLVKKEGSAGYVPEEEQEEQEVPEKPSFAVRLENSWALSIVFGLLAVLYVVRFLFVRGNSMNMLTYLFLLIALGIVLRKKPMSYQRDILKGVQVSWIFYLPIVFYGGVQGLIDASGAYQIIAGILSSFGSTLFPVVVLISSAIINVFIPHAGSQWLVEGKSIMEAAAGLGVSNVKTILAFCYGAGWTKLLLISFFVPVFGIEDVKVKDMAKYLGVMMFVSMIIYVLALLIIPA